MDRLSTPDSPLIPYALASPAQLVQALVMAREALGPYYPAVTWPHWHQAFDAIRPTLKLEAKQVNVSSEGLNELAQYLEAQSSLPGGDRPYHTEALSAPEPEEASGTQLSLSPSDTVKKTYLVRTEVSVILDRVSFWRRERKSALVNQALMQLLSSYPESQEPIPVGEGGFFYRQHH